MKKLLFYLFVAMFTLSSCNTDDVIEVSSPLPPVITLDSETAVYTVKTGRELTISPTYKYADKALYVWSIDGKVVGDEPALVFSAVTVGEVFVQLSVSTRYGTTSEELRVDVADLEVPTISLAGAENGYTVLTGNKLQLTPSVVTTSIPTNYVWTLNGTDVSTEKEYVFSKTDAGEYTLKFAAHNEDGEDTLEFKVKVCTLEEMPFSWVFEQVEYSLSAGRTLRLLPLDITNAFDAAYTWAVDGKTMQEGIAPQYLFTPSKEGEYEVTVTMKNSYQTVAQTLKVIVHPAAGRYYRAKSTSSNADWNKVYEFLAAPGQFVNENYTATTMAEACTYAESQMKKSTYISLGGFGGSIVVGFDHSIDNSKSYDFAVLGNSFDGSSEPGIIWVMQDENGDGQPNDTWFELKGSETGKPETMGEYAVTYYRPRGAKMDTQWTDNQGNSGSIDYLEEYHRQDYYYPAWIKADSYTLRGTCLKARNSDQSGNGSYWVNAEYDWGYADNYSPIDRLTDSPNAGAGANANHFKIADAVTFDGKPADLKYIDFVKVQTGVNAKSGWLGELSTEVFGFYDYSIKQ